MQKKLIALAIAGLSSAAFAQSNVTIYGVADVSFESVKAEGATAGASIPSRTRLSTNGSLIGFKGTEDLGDGLKAIYQFESNVNTDSSPNTNVAANSTGTTTSGFNSIGATNSVFGSARDTYAGLSGNFGTVKLGYLSTPLRSMVRGFDVMPGSTGVGEVGGVFATAGGTATTPSSLLFRTQSVRYDSPDFSGFSGSLAYIPSEGKSNSAPTPVANEIKPDGWNLGLNYAVGGLKVGYTYMKLNDAGTAALTDESIKTHILGASYDFGQGTTIVAQYQDTKDDQSTAAASGTLKRKAYWVAGKHVMGPHEFALAWAKAKDLEGSDGLGVAAPGDTGAKQISLRYAYNFSKRTQVYGIYSKITNESAAGFDFGTATVGNGVAISAGSDPTAFGAGIRHTF